MDFFFENNNQTCWIKLNLDLIWTQNKLSKYFKLDEKQKVQQPEFSETKSANSKKHTYWPWASLQASWAE